MFIDSIIHLLVWAHILSPEKPNEPIIQNHPTIQVSAGKVPSIQDPKPMQAHPKQNVSVSSKKDQDILVPISGRLKECLKRINKDFPKYAWSKEHKDLAARVARSSNKERYEDVQKVIQECLKCLAAQKNNQEIREIYSSFEHCKRDLRTAKAVAVFLKARGIKRKK